MVLNSNGENGAIFEIFNTLTLKPAFGVLSVIESDSMHLVNWDVVS